MVFRVFFFLSIRSCSIFGNYTYLYHEIFRILISVVYIHFFFWGVTAHFVLKLPHFWGVSISHNDTHSVGFPSQRTLPAATDNTHNRQLPMLSAEFELAVSAGELRQAYALECAATGIGSEYINTNVVNVVRPVDIVRNTDLLPISMTNVIKTNIKTKILKFVYVLLQSFPYHQSFLFELWE